ncbi:MAG: flagellar hook-basal body complex protein FliE [Spirochaetaceae bacterium]
MNISDFNTAQGHLVELARTNSRHSMGNSREAGGQETGAKNFGNLVFDALNGANDLNKEGEQLTQQFITDPDSVDPHDVTIAMNKANLAVSMTKTVVDGALKAYRDIINLR